MDIISLALGSVLGLFAIAISVGVIALMLVIIFLLKEFIKSFKN